LVQLFLIQLAIKWLFKFSPYPTYAFALSGKIKTHEIGVKTNEKTPKVIRDITDSILKNNNEILIVFGRNIHDTTAHQMAFIFSPDMWHIARYVCFWPLWFGKPTISFTVMTFSSVRVCFSLPLVGAACFLNVR